MPAPVGRDFEQTRHQLQAWLPELLRAHWDDEVSDVRVGELAGPEATGFSSDTLMFDVSFRTSRAGEQALGLVARILPQRMFLFPEYDLPAQFRILRALEPTEIAVPTAYWEEPSGDVIGAPFYLMGRVEGRIPADNPPYNAAGWVTELSPEDRAAMWRSYLETLVALRALDPTALGLGFLAKPELGDTPLAQELAYYENYLEWIYGDREHPTVSRSLPWLLANKPREAAAPSLSWGDARIGNMIFRDNRCVAVLDWEMARLGDPMMDLAWGLFLDRYHTEGNGIERLPGFPTREETIALYEALAGERVRDIEYYELLAGMRFSVILTRLAQQLIAQDFLPKDSDFEWNNPVSNLHAKQLVEMGIA
jgi:aminoglycoside phosphotransferase (APT) family kinase protein